MTEENKSPVPAESVPQTAGPAKTEITWTFSLSFPLLEIPEVTEAYPIDGQSQWTLPVQAGKRALLRLGIDRSDDIQFLLITITHPVLNNPASSNGATASVAPVTYSIYAGEPTSWTDGDVKDDAGHITLDSKMHLFTGNGLLKSALGSSVRYILFHNPRAQDVTIQVIAGLQLPAEDSRPHPSADKADAAVSTPTTNGAAQGSPPAEGGTNSSPAGAPTATASPADGQKEAQMKQPAGSAG